MYYLLAETALRLLVIIKATGRVGTRPHLYANRHALTSINTHSHGRWQFACLCAISHIAYVLPTFFLPFSVCVWSIPFSLRGAAVAQEVERVSVSSSLKVWMGCLCDRDSDIKHPYNMWFKGWIRNVCVGCWGEMNGLCAGIFNCQQWEDWRMLSAENSEQTDNADVIWCFVRAWNVFFILLMKEISNCDL